VGKSEDEVYAAIGHPKEIAGFRWRFDTEEDGEEGELKLYFGDTGKVTSVSPTDTPIAAVTRRKDPVLDDEPKPAAEQVPSGAVARCGNGLFVYVSTGANMCKTAGGVKEWFTKPKH
jgi:hypothetical protein